MQKETKPGSKSNWHRIYYVLGAFNVLSVLASVYIGHLLMGHYRDSVAENSLWAERVAGFQELGQTATRANGPGNDVFESKDIEGEERKLDEYVTQFDAQLLKARAEVNAGLPADQAAKLTAELELAKVAFHEMVREARTIFASFRKNDVEEAGRHMASMDRALGSTSDALGRLAHEARTQQGASLAAQLGRATSMQRFEWALVVLVVCMVIGVVLYGAKLARIFQESARVIEQRNQDVKRVLDNVAQGLVTVELDGRLGSEPSAAVAHLLGPIGADDTLVSWIERADEHAGMSLAMGWPELAEPFLPLEVLVDQLPKRATVGERTVALEYRPIMQGEKVERMLLVATDITSEVARERAEVEQLELLALFRLATNDPNGLREMVEELGRQIDAACDPAMELASVKRAIHTVKGNAGILGVQRLATLCHKVEEAMAERGEGLSVSEAAELQQLFALVSARAAALSGTRSDDIISIEKSELAAVLEALTRGGDRRKLANQMATWSLEPADRRLERLAELTKSLAKRLGKEVQVLVDPSGLRLPGEYAEVWAALPHVVRNAVDHGVEPADERVANAKDSSATVLLQARKEENRVVIQVCDDGRGIDWEAVRAKATRLGMAAENDEQLTDALFSDGFSTKEVATDVSGRGVGMSALKAAVEAINGEVKVQTLRTKGTTVRISLPLIGALKDLPQTLPPRAA